MPMAIQMILLMKQKLKIQELLHLVQSKKLYMVDYKMTETAKLRQWEADFTVIDERFDNGTDCPSQKLRQIG
ncbi:hypothetical protein Ancab_037356 [Ancistrocladus abbreviatus]